LARVDQEVRTVVTATPSDASRFERYSWTMFVFLSAILLLFGVTDLSGTSSSTGRENAINEIFIAGLSGAVAVMGLRRGQRWAWYAMALWPVWIGAQAARAGIAGMTAEMGTGLFLLILTVVALALSYRPAYRRN
jgi:hypothetical protein